MDISPAQIREAYGKTPRALREFMADGQLADNAEKIGGQYQLHVDAIGELAKLLNFVLLGFISPEALPQELLKIGLSSDQVQNLIRDLNAEIFIPLQKQVRETGAEPSHDERIAAEPSSLPATEDPRPSESASVAKPLQAVPVMQIGQAQSGGVVIESPVSTEPVRTKHLVNLITADQATAPLPPRTMASDMEALSHPAVQSAPQVYESKPMQTPHPWQVSPAQSFQTASIPHTSLPPTARAIPAPLPVQLPNDWKSGHAQAAEPQTSPSQPSSQNAYSADPYREPVE